MINLVISPYVMKVLMNAIYSKKLKLLRHKFDATQNTMASKLNMSQQAYCKLEKGKTKFTLNRIEEICGIFKINLKDFTIVDDLSLQNLMQTTSQYEPVSDSIILELNNHYEILFIQSELRNIKLEQKILNYKPYKRTSGKDTPLIYVMI